MCEVDFRGEAFCYSRDYPVVAFGTRPNNRFGLEMDRTRESFDDELYESSRTVRLAQHQYYWDKARARSRSKGATLRSWRKPHSCGGSIARKVVVRKFDRRAPK